MPLAPSLFLEYVIRTLLPFYIGLTDDPQEARAEILATLAEYPIRTRHDLMRVAQTLTIGMAALRAINQAEEDGISPTLQLRYRSSANSLNRSWRQNEAELQQTLDPAQPEEEAPLQNDPTPPDLSPDFDLTTIMPLSKSGSALTDAATLQRNRAAWGPALAASLNMLGMPTTLDPAAAMAAKPTNPTPVRV